MAKKAEEAEAETAINTPNKLTRARTKVDLIQAEDRDTGDIKFKDYKNFFSFSFGCCGMLSILLLSIFCAIA